MRIHEFAISYHNKIRGSENAINELEINFDTVRSTEQQFTKHKFQLIRYNLVFTRARHERA